MFIRKSHIIIIKTSLVYDVSDKEVSTLGNKTRQSLFRILLPL